MATTPRPVTRALQLTRELRENLKFWTNAADQQRFDELQETLVRIDARETKPDPSKRPKRKRPAKAAKAAKR